MATTWSDLGYGPFKDLGRWDRTGEKIKKGWRKVAPGHTVHHKETGRSGDVIAMHEKGLAVSWHDKPHTGSFWDTGPDQHLRAGDDFGWGKYELRRFGEPAVVSRPGNYTALTAPNYKRSTAVKEMVETGDVDAAIERKVAEAFNDPENAHEYWSWGDPPDYGPNPRPKVGHTVVHPEHGHGKIISISAGKDSRGDVAHVAYKNKSDSHLVSHLDQTSGDAQWGVSPDDRY